jgi:catechol 2,3-dioxygenase-like lactoylglutathione lyase family enzyme
MIYKLGHFGYMTKNYEDASKWYTSVFNLTPIDIIYSLADEKLVVASFFRLDLGEEYVDHHCLLITREDKGTFVHHSSFEVEDLIHSFLATTGSKTKDTRLFGGLVGMFTVHRFLITGEILASTLLNTMQMEIW